MGALLFVPCPRLTNALHDFAIPARFLWISCLPPGSKFNRHWTTSPRARSDLGSQPLRMHLCSLGRIIISQVRRLAAATTCLQHGRSALPEHSSNPLAAGLEVVLLRLQCGRDLDARSARAMPLSPAQHRQNWPPLTKSKQRREHQWKFGALSQKEWHSNLPFPLLAFSSMVGRGRRWPR